jgi:peptide chain release factor 2
MNSELTEHLTPLQEKYKKIEPVLKLEEKQAVLGTLQTQMGASGFWDDSTKAQEISQKAATLEQFIKHWKVINQQIQDFPELIELAGPEDLALLKKDLTQLEITLREGETTLLLSGEFDDHDAILTIHVGNGGQDAEDFSQMLYRMYLRFAERKGFQVKILEESNSEEGLRSAAIEIKGSFAYGLLKSEHGIHRLIRLSPFNAKNLRQTSFSRIELTPIITNDNDLKIADQDLRIDVFRSSGAGGQSVNTTDSAVRITYLPLNLAVTCQNERSQLQNKAIALKILKSRLLLLKMQQQAQKLDEIRGEKAEAAFGSQIRTYTLHPYKMVKDHRTNYEENHPDKVLDGHLEGFIESFLQLKD